MRILTHIHTFNDEAVIDQCIQAVLKQTRSVDAIVLVDNGSTDGTLERDFPQIVDVIRHEQNLGTSGAVRTGMQYGIAHGFDWIWILDGDSAPRADSLERLLFHYDQMSPAKRDRVMFVSSLPVDCASGNEFRGIRYTRTGFKTVERADDSTITNIDGAIWSGCLYKLQSVARLGLPSADYVLDWAEYEYGYRAIRSGYDCYMCFDSILDHNIEGAPALEYTRYRFGPIVLRLKELPPIRCYYFVRNTVFFWLREYEPRGWRTLMFCCVLIARFSYGFVLRPATRPQQFAACVQGLWFGLRGDISRRYSGR